MDKLWKQMTAIVIENLSEPNYHIFENSTSPISFENKVITVSVENAYTITWVKDKCESIWRSELSEEYNNVIFDYVVNKTEDAAPQLTLFPTKTSNNVQVAQNKLPENNFSFDNENKNVHINVNET